MEKKSGKFRVELPKDETPFSSPLIESEFPTNMAGILENHPDKIIRSYPLAKLSEKLSIKDKIEAGLKAGQSFRELRDRYHILVPVEFVIGKNENGEPALYSIVDKIEGKNLDETLHSSLKGDIPVTELDHLYYSLIEYFSDKLEKGEPLLWDIFANRQYVFGKKIGDEEGHIYLVDVDPYYTDNTDDLLEYLNELSLSLKEAGEALGVTLAAAERRLWELQKEISKKSSF